MLILPQPWASQPPFSLSINSSNPLTNGLRRLVYPNAGGDVLLNSRASYTGTVRVKPGVSGNSWYTGGAANSYVSVGAGNDVTTGKITALAIVNVAATTRGDIICIWNAGTANSQFNLLYGLTSAAPQFFVSNGAAQQSSGASSRLLTVGKDHVVVGTHDGSTTSVYVDGVLGASFSASFTLNTTSLQAMTIGNNTGLDGDLNGQVYLGAVWNRTLTAQEVFAVSSSLRAPWQIFAPLPRRIFVSVASGTPTGTLATTNANDTLAASGTAVGFTGTLAKTNANDTLAGVGTQTNTGTLAKTNANDTLAGVGYLPATGTLAVTAANDSLDASGTAGTAAGGSYGGKRKYVVKVGNQLMVFAKEADAANALPKPEKKNIPAKRGKKPVEAKEAPKPDVAISLDEIKRQADLTQMRAEVDRLLEMRRYEALISLYEEMVDEEEVEMLLLAA